MKPKACPFCKNEDLDLRGIFSRFFVFCNCCEAQGPRAHSKEKAIELWNGEETEESSGPSPEALAEASKWLAREKAMRGLEKKCFGGTKVIGKDGKAVPYVPSNA